MASRYGIPNPPFAKTVYRTPTPEAGVSEAYEIVIDLVHSAPDPRQCWIVREMHGYYDEAKKTYHHKVETLHPNEPRHFLNGLGSLQHPVYIPEKPVTFRAAV
jgi:hypothetical protein